MGGRLFDHVLTLPRYVELICERSIPPPMHMLETNFSFCLHFTLQGLVGAPACGDVMKVSPPRQISSF